MKKLRVASMADLHTEEGSIGLFRDFFKTISTKADILLLCGDLTHEGLPKEAEVLAQELQFCKIPVIGVLGNHDHTNEKEDEIIKILSAEQMHLLNHEPFIFEGVGFAGVKGFCGGFDNHLTAPFGEKVLKKFVFEAVNEAIQLEESLMKLETEKKVVLLHYSPIRDTVVGEPLEIYPMLGTSRLLEPIENFGVTAVFHGHAHHGTTQGTTSKGIPVYNCAFPLLKKMKADEPYVIVEI